MNVFIVTEGGKNIGLGHIARCISIYQAFEEVGIQSQLIVNGDETVEKQLKDKNCKVFDWLNDREMLFAVLRDADIVFVDSYLADYDLYENISKIVKTAVYFDDDIRIDYPKGFVVNGAIFAEQIPYPKRKEVVYLLGAQYAPLRKEFWDVPAKSICDSIESVLITFGGSDIRNLTPKVLKLLVDTYPGLVKKVIIGKGFRSTAEIEDIKDHNTELVYYPDAAGMKKVMLESDIAISASGQTLYELGRIGVPTIVIIVVPVPDNLMKSFQGMEKSGIIEYAGNWQDNCLTEKIKRHIEKLSCRNLRQSKSSRLREVFDGESALRLVRRIIK
jgi:spore coat polysaccharide biosynthesis predicted glycosyltransferase SpsG